MNTSIEEKAAPAVLTHEMSDPEMFVSLLQGFRESGEVWTFILPNGM
jgi:hypothetical protein